MPPLYQHDTIEEITCTWEEWLEFFSQVLRASTVNRVVLTTLPRVQSSEQGDGRNYWLADLAVYKVRSVFFHDKAWVEREEIVLSCLKSCWREIEFRLDVQHKGGE